MYATFERAIFPSIMTRFKISKDDYRLSVLHEMFISRVSNVRRQIIKKGAF